MAELIETKNFKSLIDVVLYFKDEITCLDYLEKRMWDNDIHCPHCGMNDPYRYNDKKRFACTSCKKQFTVKVGTIFEGSKLPMLKWFMAIYLITTNKKGISSYELAKHIGVTQKTAWFMAHRIRKPLDQKGIELEGIVESDETFVGGKNKNRHTKKKVKYGGMGRSFDDKVPVLGMMEQKGKLKTVVLSDVKTESIKPVVLNTVKWNSILITDEYDAYHDMKKFYHHEVVRHNAKVYVNAVGATTNNIEGFWSHLKRMIIGTYHQVSPKHLQRYCDEITFRFNTRKLNETERLSFYLTKVNCRLKYKHLIKAA